MSVVTYPRNSPYADTPQTSWYLGRYVDRPVPADTTDQLVTIAPQYDMRPDRMSNDLYGTPAYYWVFMRRNLDVIRQVMWDFRAGLPIYVPTKARLQSLGL